MTDYTCRNHLFSTPINSIRIELIESPNFSKGPPRKMATKTGPKNRKNREQNLNYSRRGRGLADPWFIIHLWLPPPRKQTILNHLMRFWGARFLVIFIPGGLPSIPSPPHIKRCVTAFNLAVGPRPCLSCPSWALPLWAFAPFD